jgi:multidrug efflux pump subunit AcrB
MPSVYYNLVMNKDNMQSYAQAVIYTESTDTVKQIIGGLQEKLDRQFPETLVVCSLLGQGPPIESPIQLRIKGPSVENLRLIGEQVRQVLAETPGVIHTRASMSGGLPRLLADIDEEAASRAGLRLADVAGQLQANMEGMVGGSVLEGTELLPVRVRYDDGYRSEMSAINNLNLATPNGNVVSLQALGDLELVPEPSAITRRDGERANYIEGYIEFDALPMEVNRAFMERLEANNFQLPPGYKLEVGGDAESQSDAIANLLLYLPILLTLMVATIVLSFRSFALAALIGSVGLFSVGLSTLAIFFSGYPFGFNPILGTAGLIGVALNDSIVVLAAIRGRSASRAGQVDAVLREVMGCSRHVLATTLTTIGGFLPLLLFTPGDFWPPLAVVMAGGVAGATLLAVIFIPSGYLVLLKFIPSLGKMPEATHKTTDNVEVAYS